MPVLELLMTMGLTLNDIWRSYRECEAQCMCYVNTAWNIFLYNYIIRDAMIRDAHQLGEDGGVEEGSSLVSGGDGADDDRCADVSDDHSSDDCADDTVNSNRAKGRAAAAAKRGLSKPAGDSLKEKLGGKKGAPSLGKGGINGRSSKQYSKYEAIFFRKFAKRKLTTIDEIAAYSENASTRPQLILWMKEMMLGVACASITGSPSPLTHFCSSVKRLFQV
jgi:hypothetical protein